MIEGMVIAGRAIGSNQGYIYIRGEYRYVLDIVETALKEAYAKGFLGKNILGTGFNFDISGHTGAGAYECGEESALMESLEGKRGYPRIKPPFPAVVGLYGCPTIINNVETLATVPADHSRRRRMVCRPRHSEKRRHAPLFHLRPRQQARNLRTAPRFPPALIEEVAGGMSNGKKLKAVIPGGSSCPLLSADEIDVAMDYDSVAKIGSMLGSGGPSLWTKIPAWWTSLAASCTSTRTNPAAGAFPAAKAPRGCAKCSTASMMAAGAKKTFR